MLARGYKVLASLYKMRDPSTKMIKESQTIPNITWTSLMHDLKQKGDAIKGALLSKNPLMSTYDVHNPLLECGSVKVSLWSWV